MKRKNDSTARTFGPDGSRPEKLSPSSKADVLKGVEKESKEVRDKVLSIELERRIHEADRLYLQQQLDESDRVMNEWKVVLDMLEAKEIEMEKALATSQRENKLLQEEVARLNSVLAFREAEITQLKGITSNEETF